MKKDKYIAIILCATCALSMGARYLFCPDPLLDEEIANSSILHAALPLHYEKGHEAQALKQRVLDSLAIAGEWSIAFDTQPQQRAVGSANDPDYAIYGRGQCEIDIDDADWKRWDRLTFDVRPECDGARVVNINVALVNQDFDHGNVTNLGHLINLVNYEDNHCYLDLSDFSRDCIQKILFYVDKKGQDLTTGRDARYAITNLCLKAIESEDSQSGWLPAPDRLVYSYSGYEPQGEKSAIVHPDVAAKCEEFRLLDADGNTAYAAKPQVKETSIGRYGVLDFSAVSQPGVYRLQIGNLLSECFPIDFDIWVNSQWRVLNFIFCQRCGYPVSGVHGSCHADLMCEHNGVLVPYCGGWHDAGDLSQQTLQTAETAFALLEEYQALKDTFPILAARMREEAEWGLNFVLKCRLGDGYHASSMGLLIWQDGKLRTFDDITSVRVNDCAYDNFIYAALEAMAAMTLADDPSMQQHLTQVAQEDFAYALEKYRRDGADSFTQPYEHTYSTSPSQFAATASWAASILYALTGNEEYAITAVEEGDKFLQCQQQLPIGEGQYCGFFYRDADCRSVVHSVHQCREQAYMQALQALCLTQPQHAEAERWRGAMRLYADYLLALMPLTAPYGMMPSGIYRVDEWEDTKAFDALHQFTTAASVDEFRSKIASSQRVNDEYVVRRFPIWVNIYNGNNAIILSLAKAAAICGKCLDDPRLTDMARQQLYWIVGKNPFGQSLIFGEGWNYPQMDSFSSGELTGEMPVGIRSLDDSDTPYWPSVNNACYKEVWVTSAAKYLSLLAEMH